MRAARHFWQCFQGGQRLLLLVLLLGTAGLSRPAQAQPGFYLTSPADTVVAALPAGPAYRPTLRQLALPAALLSVAVLSTKGVGLLPIDGPVQRQVQARFPGFQTTVDDQLRHVPAAASLALGLVGVRGVHSTVNQGVVFFLAYTINNTLTSNLKTLTRVERPYGNDFSSFPSQHSSAAFAAATFLHREYGGRSVWYSIGGYSVATATATLRVLGNKHWVSDVLAGAGVGIISTQLAYWAYPAVHRLLVRGLNDRAVITPLFSNGATGAALCIWLR
jgi:membrane-associated phospholipid phosphatase